jgi:1-acyl-sn-glycerol-3-phosphate acyltransferase
MNLRRLDLGWRVVATGFAIAVIFVGGGLLAAFVLPWAMLLPGDPRERSQEVVRLTFRWYLRGLLWIGLVRLQMDGEERLIASGGRIVVANHPSLLDVVILMAIIPKAQCIVKHQLWDSRLLGGLVRRAGYIRNDLEADALLAACKEGLDRGAALIVFPEGTRTCPGALPHFQRGFANLAIMTGAAIVPVLIDCQPPTLTKGERWWQVPERRPVFRVEVGECVDAATYTRCSQRGLAARRLVADLERNYATRLSGDTKVGTLEMGIAE